jgi:SnoaL-like domain
MTEADAALQGLLDKQAIAEVLHRYARGCDRADEALLRSCFHPESSHRHGAFAGTSADFCTLAMNIILGTRLEKHQVSNVLVELDGDRAVVESHYVAYHRQVNRSTSEEEDMFSGGRFIDRFERRNGAWRIAARVGLIDYERFDPVTERGVRSLAPALRSRRQPDDELYTLLPSLRGAH